MTARRVQNQPAWLLHHRPFQDSSRILDVFSRDHGRLSLVARGSRSARSKLKGILRPFLPLQLSWVIRSDLGTLTGAEMNGTPISLTGDALLSAYYLNELLLNLLHLHDPQPEIFTVYDTTIGQLNSQYDVAMVLRRFELELLRLLGYALILDHDTETGAALDPASEFKPNVAEFMRIQRESVAAWVKEGQESGEIRPEIDAGRIAEQFYGSLIGLNNQWLVAPEIDLRAAYEDYKQNILRLLSAELPSRK